jgi:outer membrane lipoprotein LolB
MKKISVIVVTVLLTGCASFLPQTSPPSRARTINHYLPWETRKAQLNNLQHWQARGNLAAHTTDKRGINTSFSWEQNHHCYQLIFFGPLGSQSAVLAGNPDRVGLTTHRQTYTAQNPEGLLADQLGLHLPVSQLYYWLRGLPAPQSRYTTNLDAYNHLLKLRQSGWCVNYTHYTNSGAIDLPDRLEITNGQWQVRIAITRWDRH